MASVINAVSGSGITQTADGSGVLKIQSNSVTTNALAWVNYSAAPSTCTIRASYYVSSVTYNAAGDHTINFTAALADANYSASGMAQAGGVGEPRIISVQSATAPTTTALRVYIQNDGGTLKDTSYNFVQVHGN